MNGAQNQNGTIDGFKYAKEVLPEDRRKLYKFRAFDREYPERVSRIITHHELYFPCSAELNDPFECRPIVRPPRLETFADRWRAERHVRAMLMRHGTPRAEAKRRAKYASNPVFMQERAQEMSQALPGGMQSYRLCSFSATWEPILLWSHYADAHRGICIGFRADNDDFGSALGVEYSKKVPSVGFLTEEPNETVMRSLILTKADVWSYEAEFRLITHEPPIYPQIQLAEHRYHYAPEHLTDVILGCETQCEDETRVRDWIAIHGLPVNLYRARRSASKFSLELVPA
jgi:Protein of unknown function (DUF2971)